MIREEGNRVEVNLHRMLELDKSDLNGSRDQYLRCCCARTELITSDLICPSTYQLLQNSSSDSGPNLSFDKPTSPELLFSLVRVSLAEASKPNLSFRCSGGDYTSSCPLSLVSAKLACPLGLNKVITFEVLCQSLQIEPTVTLFKHYKSGFFFIDRRAILDAMVWRYPDATIDNPRPAAGSFNMADVRRLSAHVIKLRDMPEGALVLSRFESIIGIHDFCCLLKWTGAEVQEEPHLDVRSTLQRLSFYCTSPATNDVVILDPTPEDLVADTPSSKILAKAKASQKRKASTSGATSGHVAKHTRVGALLLLLLKALTSEGKGIMVDDAAAPSGGASRPRPSSRPAPSFKNVFDDAIHKDFFPFHAEMSVLHYMMMSHGGELFARYHRLNQYHHEYVLSTNSRLKGNEEKVSSLTRLELQVSTLKKHVSRINDKLATSNAFFTKSKAKEKERKKKITSLTKSMDNLHSEVARLFVALNQATILEAERDEEILRLVQGELLFLAASAGFERGLSMHRTNDEFAAILKKMVNFMPAEMVNAEFDGSDPKMTDDTAAVMYGHAFVHGISVALDDVTELVEVGSRRVLSDPDDVVVALSAHEKGEGLDSSSTAIIKAAINPSRV
uniref:Transposase (Putative), gypsy type n=1 Tax=Tanacetum cinerariifolium TaxID=118510 RepID=A0A6L2M804_TANCI|nr:hypothetical protein [Tanacetum cinerariifolium]